MRTGRLVVRVGAVLLGGVLLSCTGGEGDDDDLGQLDPRCEALCSDDDATCTADVTECEQVCQARIAGVSASCATCLLDNSNGGTCAGGETCCPDPEFPSSALDCAALCEGSVGVNPSGTHPLCDALCSDEDPSCADEVTLCLQECQARIQGVTGLCATCLLEDANGGTCAGGTTCCPDPEFPTSVTDCAALCNG